MLLSFLVQTSYAAISACSNNYVGGACIGDITYTSSAELSNNVNASGGIVVNAGTTLTTNGFSIFIGGNFINSGILVTGDGALGPSGNTGVGAPGNSVITSFSGCGGGAGKISDICRCGKAF